MLGIPWPLIFVWQFACLHKQRPINDGNMTRTTKEVAEAGIIGFIRTEILPRMALDVLGDMVENLNRHELMLVFGLWLFGVHVDSSGEEELLMEEGRMAL